MCREIVNRAGYEVAASRPPPRRPKQVREVMADIPSACPDVPDTYFIRPDEENEIENLMLHGCSDPDGSMIVVVGMGGSGKTCICSKVTNSSRVRRQFEMIAWINIGSESSIPEIQSALYHQLTGRPLDTQIDAIAALKSLCKGKKNLLVLDDGIL